MEGLNIDDVKWLLFYGHTKDKSIELKTAYKGELDYAITQLFEMMEESSRFNSDMVEKAFWERLHLIANLQPHS